MTRPSRSVATFIRVGAAFGFAGAVMAALGILSIAKVIRGGDALGIFALVVAAVGFGLAGYFFWGSHWLTSRPEKLQEAEHEATIRPGLQRRPEEPSIRPDSDDER